jgi:hypothetical protein
VPNAEINLEKQITYIDSNNFSITVTTAATSTATGLGGTGITAAFQILRSMGTFC